MLLWATAGPGLGGAMAFLALLPHAETLRGGGFALAGVLLLFGAAGCGLALIPTHLLSLVAGWSLGVPMAAATTLLAVTAAAWAGHAAGRRVAGPALAERAARDRRGAALLAAIAAARPRRAALLVALVRLSPVVPFAVTNLLAAVSGVRRGPLLLGTPTGLAPRVVAVVLLGAGLEELAWERPDAPWLIAAGVAATVAGIGVLGWLTRRVLTRLVPDEAPRTADETP